MGLRVGEKSVSQLVLAVAVFKGTYSHLKYKSGYKIGYLTSNDCR